MPGSAAVPRHCLVTGANRGLGLEFVRQLLARGDRVVATCRHPGRATALNALAGEHPGRLQVLPLDVAVARSREELVRELPLVLDGARIDLLINNAGLLHGGERFGQVAQSDSPGAAILAEMGKKNDPAYDATSPYSMESYDAAALIMLAMEASGSTDSNVYKEKILEIANGPADGSGVTMVCASRASMARAASSLKTPS